VISPPRLLRTVRGRWRRCAWFEPCPIRKRGYDFRLNILPCRSSAPVETGLLLDILAILSECDAPLVDHIVGRFDAGDMAIDNERVDERRGRKSPRRCRSSRRLPQRLARTVATEKSSAAIVCMPLGPAGRVSSLPGLQSGCETSRAAGCRFARVPANCRGGYRLRAKAQRPSTLLTRLFDSSVRPRRRHVCQPRRRQSCARHNDVVREQMDGYRDKNLERS
jgi:hypothetical protein